MTTESTGADGFTAGGDRGGPGGSPDTLLTLLGTLRDVLGVETVDPVASFLDHGGSSLQAIRTATRLGGALGIRVPPESVLSAPSLKELADHLDSLRGQAAATPAPAATAESPAGTVPNRASMAQEWVLLSRMDDPDAPALQFHVVYRLGGPFRPEVFRGALRMVLDQHASLRTSFRVVDGIALQEVADDLDADLTVEDVSTLPAADRTGAARRVLEREVHRGFDSASGSRIRARVVRCAPDEHYLALVLDHLVADGWSLEVVTQDLGTAYSALLHGDRPVLTEAGSYLDWSREQWARFDAGRGDELSDYWSRQLGPDPGEFALKLPGYQDNGGLSGPSAVTLDVPGEVTTRLSSACQELRTTPYCLTMTALKALIAHETGRRRVTVLTTSANRADSGYEDTVGWFANGVFPTSDVDLGLSFRRLLHAVQPNILAAMSHGDAPAVYVRRRIWPEVSGGFRKDPGVYFMYNALWGMSLRLDGVRIDPVVLDEVADSPGLHLWLLEHEGALQLSMLHYRSEYLADYVRGFGHRFLAAIEALARRLDEPVDTTLEALSATATGGPGEGTASATTVPSGPLGSE
jgi:acyl carrier protein